MKVVNRFLYYFDLRLDRIKRIGQNPFHDIVNHERSKISDGVILDVGANLGQSSERFQFFFPNNRIIAFEPDSNCVNIIEAKFQSSELVKVESYAIGSEEGDTTFFKYGSSELNSIYKYGGNENAEVVKVPQITLDTYCLINDINDVFILKTDTQGNDYHVLLGAKNILKFTKYVLVEVVFDETYEGTPKYYSIFKILEDNGFRIVSSYKVHYRDNLAYWSDFLFINQNYSYEKGS